VYHSGEMRHTHTHTHTQHTHTHTQHTTHNTQHTTHNTQHTKRVRQHNSRSERPEALADDVRLVGAEAMHGVRILCGVDANRLEPKLRSRAANTNGDLTTIRHQQLFDRVEFEHLPRQRELDFLAVLVPASARARARIVKAWATNFLRHAVLQV
jgi:hypothetical protein